MSLFLGVLSAAVALDDSDYKKKLKGLEESSEDSFSRIAAAAGRYLTAAAILNFGRQAIQTYSDLEEATNKFNVVFQGFSKQAGDAIDELREKFGQSELSAKQMLSGTGDILTGFGFDRKLALDMSVLTAQLGSDLASFTNYAGGAAGATDALTKAMLGETESAKMLGIVIKQDSEEYKNLVEQAMTTGVQIKEGGEKIVVTNEQQAKAVAALALAYQQSKNAHGDFLRSQDSIANQTQILKNNLTELYTVIGKDSASAYSQALQGANALLKWYTNLSPATRTMTNNTTLLTVALVLLGKKGYLASANAAVRAAVANLTFAGSTKAAAAGTGIMTVAVHGLKSAFHALNVAMGPVGWAILAIGAAYTAVTAIISAYEAEISGQIDAANKLHEAEKKETELLKEKHSIEQQNLQRLEELAKYEHLNSDEKKEASKIADELNKNYKDLGITIDKMTGKLHVNADAWRNMSTQQMESEKKQLKEELKTLYGLQGAVEKEAQSVFLSGVVSKEDMIGNSEKSWFDAAVAIRKGSLAELKEIESILTTSGDDDAATAAIQKVIALKEEELRLRKRMEELEEYGVKAAEKRKKQEAEKERKKREEAKTAVKEQVEFEYQLKFDSSDYETQLDMLKAKTEEVFAEIKRTSKFNTVDSLLNASLQNLTVEELNARRKILEIRQQEKSIVKKIGEEERKQGEEERKRREDAKKDREQRMSDLDALIHQEIQIEFENADVPKKIDLLELQKQEMYIRFLQKKFGDAYKDMTEESKKDLFQFISTAKIEDLADLDSDYLRLRRQFTDLENQKNNIKRQNKADISQEKKEYDDYFAARKRSKAEEEFFEQIAELEKNKDFVEAQKMLESKIVEFQAKAKKAEQSYLESFAKFQEDGLLSDEEREILKLHKESYKRYYSDIDRLENARKNLQPPDADGELDKRHDRARETIGAWSLAALSRMTADSPEVQTARNTKETSRKMTELLELEKQRPALTY